MKRTYQPNRRRRVKRHGFLSRKKRPGGQRTIRRRRAKGRRRLALR